MMNAFAVTGGCTIVFLQRQAGVREQLLRHELCSEVRIGLFESAVCSYFGTVDVILWFTIRRILKHSGISSINVPSGPGTVDVLATLTSTDSSMIGSVYVQTASREETNIGHGKSERRARRRGKTNHGSCVGSTTASTRRMDKAFAYERIHQ